RRGRRRRTRDGPRLAASSAAGSALPGARPWHVGGSADVRLHGRSAALRFQASFDLVVFGGHLTHAAWLTELYERQHGRWQLVWEQATAIPNDVGAFLDSISPKG